MRVGLRGALALALYLLGYHHAALVLGIMCAMILVSTVEGQAAKAIAASIPRAKKYLKKRRGNA